MDAARSERIEAILFQARTMSLDDQARFLDGECAGDLALRAELGNRLSVNSAGPVVATAGHAPESPVVRTDGSPVDDSAPAINAFDSIAFDAVVAGQNSTGARTSHLESQQHVITREQADLPIGHRIGLYQLTARIGGAELEDVYQAAQDDELGKQVVVRLFKWRSDGDAFARRFETELPVLVALARHPNISALLDAGTTEDGGPYVVVEYVDGRPIDEYCDHGRLTIPARLRLFAKVCEVVHFAHRHAMIHGDLKPTNILVTPEGVPKLLNLGIAQLLQPEVSRDDGVYGTRATLSGTAGLVLTPEYASPEQVGGETVTTASDVYALGVVLYQLLCGRQPYQLTTQSTPELFQAICDQVPEKPSLAVDRRLPEQTALSTDPVATVMPAVSADAIAANRGLSAPRLKRALAGDLDAIVSMAMRKEPEWRYTSAEQFGDDLARHGKCLPPRAHRDSLVYRTTRFIQRHAVAVALGLLLVMALTSGIIGTTTSLIVARNQRQAAENSYLIARQTVDRFFTDVDEERLLNQPGLRPLRNALLQDAQGFYEDMVKRRHSDPSVRPQLAMAHARLGKIINLTRSSSASIAQYQQAVSLWEKLVNEQPDHEDYQVELVQTLGDLGAVLIAMGGPLDEALDTLRRAQELVEHLIATHPQSISERMVLGKVLLNIAEIQWKQGTPDKAVLSLERALEIQSQLIAEAPGSIEPEIALAEAHGMLGRLLAEQPSELVEAIAAYHRAIELHEVITRKRPELADQSERLAKELSALSGLQEKTGQHEPALESLGRAAEIFKLLERMNPGVAAYRHGLGTTYDTLSDLQRQRGESAEALVLGRKALTLFERLVAENPNDTQYRRDLAKSHNGLGRLLAQAGEPSEALRSFQRASDKLESLPHLDPKDYYNLACNVAQCIPLIGVKNGSRGVSEALSKGDHLRRKLYGDRAIESLRRAARDGLLNADMVQNNPDLNPLRARADFQAFVKEIDDTPSTSVK